MRVWQRCVTLLVLAAYAPAPVGSGRVFAVGSNGCGQLGDGTRTNVAVPKEITRYYDPEQNEHGVLTNLVRQVVASSGDDPLGETGYTLYLTNDGRVLASGYNELFQLIDEETVPSTREPVIVTSLGDRHIVQVAAGRTHSLFLDSEGWAYAVGFNSFGQLGLGTESSEYNRQPQRVRCPQRLTQVATNQAGSHSLFRTIDGRVLVTGLNEHGQLGTNSFTNVNTPTPMLDPTGETFSNETLFSMVAAGKTFSLLLDSDGGVFSVGGNDRGQLGTGELDQERKLPVLIDQWPVSPPPRIVHVAAGAEHSLFCDNTGRIFAVGDNSAGQLGDARGPLHAMRRTPVELVKRWNSPGFEDGASCQSSGQRDERTCVRHVVAGARSSFFRTEAGKIFASGGNELHQLGGTWPDTIQIVPMELHDVALSIAQLSSAGSHTVFLSAECENTNSPCSAVGTEECINVETEPTAPTFTYTCKCKAGWANGICAENFLSEYADQCNVTLEGPCDLDVDECASSPCQRGSCDDSASCAAKLANDKLTTSCEYGDRDCQDAQEELQKEREADNCGFTLEPDQFMCTCEDNGLLGSYTSSEIGREPVPGEQGRIPTEMEPGLVCDKEVGPNILFFSMMAVLSLVVLMLLAFGAVVTNMKMQDKKSRVHP